MNGTLRKLWILILAMCIAAAACLSGCSDAEPNFPVAVSDPARSALELCADDYKDGDLSEIYDMMCGGASVADLDASYPIDCLRKDDDGYRVLYQGNNRVLVLCFDADGNWVYRDRLDCLYRMVDSRGKYDALSVGDSIVEVQKIDPTCYFSFLAEGSEELHPSTVHYTEDGYCTHITYQKGTDGYTIQSIDYEIM